MTPKPLTRRSRGRLVALAAMGVAVATAPQAVAQTTQTAPPGVNCAFGDPQYGYGPSYGTGGVPSYGIGAGTSAGTGNPGAVRLTRGQLLINQRISQAAVRRANALRTRLLTGLTGGDVRDGSLTLGQVRLGTRIISATPVATPAPASVTVIVNGPAGNPGAVTLSRRQILINQRISQAAVRRANAIIAHLRTGLNGNDFRDGTLTAVDLAPGTVTP